MFASLFRINGIATLVATIIAWSIGGFATPVNAQCNGSCGSHGGHAGHDAMGSMDMGSMGHQHEGAAGDHAGQDQSSPPHNGQMTKMDPLNFEAVYLPQQVRLYIYGLMPYPASAKEARGDVVMQVRDNPRLFRYPLHYVAPPAGSGEQDYLAAAVDLTRIRDGDMLVTFNLENLPLLNHPKLTFAQTFAMSKAKPQVTLAALTESDRAGVARQQVCPVTGARLGAMGDPVKVLIDGRPLYLCCNGCVSKVKSNPEAYMPRAKPQVTLAALTEGDRAGIARQGVCPVSGRRLGAMGDPVKIVVAGHPLYLCCRGCLAKVAGNPEVYLAKAAHSTAGAGQ